MRNHSIIELLRSEIDHLSFDAKTEVLLALALEKGLTYSDVSICTDSNFHREYSKDIFYTEVREDALKKTFLTLHLTRNGLYELLPEGLFFSGKRLDANSSLGGTETVELYEQNLQIEKEIRQFFMPFENEIFWQRIQLAKQEIMLPEALQSNYLNDYFARFWDIPDLFPKEFLLPFIQILPYTHQSAGNFHLTAQCLEHLIKERVNVKEVLRPAFLIHSQGLGNQQLSFDTICSDAFLEDDPALEFTIGPLKYSQVQDYLKGGNREMLVETFYKFFVPAGLEVQTRIEVSAEECSMQFKAEVEPILGYSTVL